MTVQEAEKHQSSITPRFALNLWTFSLVLVVIGTVISGYLSYVKLADVEIICGASEGASGESSCDTVQNYKRYSEILGIPVAYLGLATYLVIGALLLFDDRGEFMRENSLLLLFGLALFAFLYSVYLVYVQGVVIEAWCRWCLAHEATMTVLFGVTSWRLLRMFASEEE